MSEETVIQVEALSKRYRLGEISTGTLAHDMNRWWHRVRGRPDPYQRVVKPGLEWNQESPSGSDSADFTQSSDYVWALEDLNFEVTRGEVLGIIGRNGAGKSTLLKILSRITAPTSGEVRIKGRVSSLLEVGTGFHRDLTGRENVFLNGAVQGMTKAEIRAKLEEIVDFSGCERYIDTPVKRYSSGMVVRLGFAVAAHLEPEILIVDEVLAVGDAEFQKKCIGKMQDVAGCGRTVLFVSHNMASVRSLCTSGIFIQGGRIEYRGTCEEVVSRYREMQDAQRGNAYPPGVLFDSPVTEPAEFLITRIDVLDTKGQPKSSIHTWDELTFRIHYYAPEAVVNASVWLQISTEEEVSIIRVSTQPDSNRAVSFTPGTGYVDCIIPQFPLPEGRYWIGGGLAVPKLVPLFKDLRLGKLVVDETDVFHSGFPPSSSRMLTVIPHAWEIPSP